MSVGIVIPSYGQWEYVRSAIESALIKTDAVPHVILVDDASPVWDISIETIKPLEIASRPEAYLHIHRFSTNGGLTRSWNKGLEIARDLGCDYACCTNSDVIFSKNWDLPIHMALSQLPGTLAGPVTNAPGSEREQYVGKYRKETYPLSDVQEDIDAVGAGQRKAWRDAFMRSPLNGFCLFARTEDWFDNAYDAQHVFRPRNDFNSKGQKNPTPLMTLNEYELQARWKGKIGLIPASFVFHYRAVSRGDAYKKGKWLRKASCP